MLNWLLKTIRQITFSDVGSIASLISLGMTFYVLYTVRKIKNFYVFKARVPELTEQLEGHASKLVEFHGDFKNSKEKILLEIGKAEVTLKSLEKKVGRRTKKSVAVVVNLIRDYSPYNQSQDYLWKIYVELQKVIQEVIDVQSDRAWENPNG